MSEKLVTSMTTKELIDRATDNYSVGNSLSYELAVRLDMILEGCDGKIDSNNIRSWTRDGSYANPFTTKTN